MPNKQTHKLTNSYKALRHVSNSVSDPTSDVGHSLQSYETYALKKTIWKPSKA